ncbi:reverse transcriptase domain-containing protein [Tanacetum coccineum]
MGKSADPHRHIADFLEISNLLQYGENQEEIVKLRTFPLPLSREAKIWLNELNERTITTWNEMREAFISRYFSLTNFKCLLNEIQSFHQLDHETLIDAWLRFKEMLHTCYRPGLIKGTIIQIFYHGLDDPTHGLLDAIGIFLYKTLNEAFKILKDRVLLKLDFSKDSHIQPYPKTIVSAGGSNVISNHEILMEKFKPLAIKIDSKFIKIRGKLKEMLNDMGDDVDISTLTMEQYMALIQNDIRPGMVKPEIDNDVELEISSNLIRELKRKLFIGAGLEVEKGLPTGVINTWGIFLRKSSSGNIMFAARPELPIEDHSHNWYHETTTKEKINDILDNIDAIQESFKEAHPTKECPLKKEDKAVKQGKYMRSLEETIIKFCDESIKNRLQMMNRLGSSSKT